MDWAIEREKTRKEVANKEKVEKRKIVLRESGHEVLTKASRPVRGSGPSRAWA